MQRRTLLAATILLALPAGPAPAQGSDDLQVTRAWSRAARQGGSGVGFLTVRNAGGAPDRLLSATTPAAGRVELHTHVRDGEVLRMRPVQTIDLPAGQTVTLQPGGLHLMLLGLTRPLVQGEAVPVTLTFERAGTVEASLAVQAAGAAAPAPAPTPAR